MRRKPILSITYVKYNESEGVVMALYKIMDLYIDIQNNYPLTTRISENYFADDQTISPHFSVQISDEMIEKKRERVPDSGDDYLESLCIFEEVSQQAIAYEGFVIHAAAVAIDNMTYLFAAASGVGKSTLASSCKQKFQDRVIIINGDKPLIRKKDDKYMAYGTPWCGKEGQNVNVSLPIAGLCFLVRSDKCKVNKITLREASELIFKQVSLPTEEKEMDSFLSMLDSFLCSIPAFILEVNKDELIQNGMKGVSKIWQQLGE